jgi:hypothetical protein
MADHILNNWSALLFSIFAKKEIVEKLEKADSR